MKKIVNQKITALMGYGLFYTLVECIEALAPFVLAPLLTHYLTVYEYGLWAIFQSATAFLRPLLGLTFEDYVRMRYYKQPREQTLGYLYSIVLISGVLAALLAGAGMIWSQEISHVLRFPANWLWAISLCAWLFAMFYLVLTYQQFDANRKRLALVQLMQSGITITATVALVIGGWGWQGAVLGKILGLSCGFALGFAWLALPYRMSASTYFQPAHVLELCSFGLRYLGNGMVLVVVVLTNRLMLANMLDVRAASLFAIASLFPMALFIGVRGLLLAWQPWCFARLSRQDPANAPLLWAGAGLYALALPFGALVLGFGAHLLGPYVIDAQFNEAYTYVYPLMVTMVFQGYYQFAQTILQFYQKLQTLSWIALFTIAANVWLNWLLIPGMGTVGSAWATAAAFALAFVITSVCALVQLRRHYKRPTAEDLRV